MGDWYALYAYASEYRLAREVFRYARCGVGSSSDIEEVEKLLTEWNDLYAARMALRKSIYHVDQDSEHGTPKADKQAADDRQSENGSDRVEIAEKTGTSNI